MAGKASKTSGEQAPLVHAAARECSLVVFAANHIRSDDALDGSPSWMTAAPPYTELPSASSSQQPHPHAVSTTASGPQRYPSGPTAFSSLPAPGPALHARADQQYAYLSARAQARQADRRAARRLCAAVAWAFVLWLVMGLIVGGVLGNELARRTDGHRRHGHGRQPQRSQDGWQIARARRVRMPLPLSRQIAHPDQRLSPLTVFPRRPVLQNRIALAARPDALAVPVEYASA